MKKMSGNAQGQKFQFKMISLTKLKDGKQVCLQFFKGSDGESINWE